MTRNLVLHIGLRKTGSSSLQEIFSRESDALMGLGIDYPERITEFPAHQELAWSLMQPPPPYWPTPLLKEEVYDHFCEVIDRNIDAGRTTLLSSEDLSLLTLNFTAMEYLKHRFGSYDPLIVFYQRDPVEYLISNYKHAVVAGRETRNFSDYVFNINTLMFSDPRMFKQVWKNLFGTESVKVLNYSRERLNKRSIYCDFLKSIFDIDVPDEYKNYRSNSGVPDDAVNYLLSMNRSNLTDEDLNRVKKVVRNTLIPSDDQAFLARHLTDEKLETLRRLFSS